MTDLKKVTDEDLKKEVDRRKGIERDRIRLHRGIVEQYVDTLLLFVPKHCRTSCSDEGSSNAQAQTGGRIRCHRCELLWIKRNCGKGVHENMKVSVRVETFVEEVK
jgi:hypothetical protein